LQGNPAPTYTPITELHALEKPGAKQAPNSSMTSTETLNPTEVARLAVDLAAEKLATDIVMMDLRELTVFADYFVVMTADSVRQIEALEEDMTNAMKDAGIARHHREGTPASGWVLLDFADVIIHIFGPEERDFFGLERLWSRAPQVVRIL
jgi:ribosome-associated protein